MKINNVFLSFCFAASITAPLLQAAPAAAIAQQPATYPDLPVQRDDAKKIIPICSSFSLYGDNALVGKQMLASSLNFLKGMEFLPEESRGRGSFLMRHRGNNEFLGREGTKNVKNMVAQQSPLVTGLMGTEMFLSLEKFISKKKALFLFPFEGNVSLREKKYENVIYFRPSYEVEIETLVKYVVKKRFRSEIAILYEASEWGKRVLQTLTQALARRGITAVKTAAYPQGSVRVKGALKELANASPNAIFCLAHPRPAYNFIGKALDAGLHNALFVGLSELTTIQKLLKTARGIDLIVSAVVPDPQNSTMQIAQEYREAMKSFLSFRADTPFYFEAYLGLELLAECISRLDGVPTIPKIIAQFEKFNEVYKGFEVRFNPQDRSLSPRVWINEGVGKPLISDQESENNE